MAESFILRGVTGGGAEVFYTGRAGEYWTSDVRADAFDYSSLEWARTKAKNFNRMVDIHGVWFVAVPMVEAAPVDDHDVSRWEGEGGACHAG